LAPAPTIGRPGGTVQQRADRRHASECFADAALPRAPVPRTGDAVAASRTARSTRTPLGVTLSRRTAHAAVARPSPRRIQERNADLRIGRRGGAAFRCYVPAPVRQDYAVSGHQKGGLDVLCAELGRILADASDFSLVITDLERFKLLNDTHGHQAGDKALSLYADVIKQCLRENDLAARWGGEEFVIVLRQSNAEDAAQWTERVRDLLEMRLSTASSVRFTSSYGIADASLSRNLTERMRLADEALYVSKENGRNRTTIAGRDGQPSAQRHDAEENAAIDNDRLSHAS